MKATELSNKNAAASKARVISGDDLHQTIPEGSDEAKLYVGNGLKYNKRNGTVSGLEQLLGRSRFDRK